MTALTNRYEVAILVDIQDGNPNGDPDADNEPRQDGDTGQGLITDVCLKRKIRNFITLTKAGQPGMDIYVKERAVLHNLQAAAYTALNIPLTGSDSPEPEGEAPKKGSKPVKPAKKVSDIEPVDQVRKYMCENYFDIRTFGAVMSSKEANAGQVRGPVQITFGRSIDPIETKEHKLTRMAVATAQRAADQGGENRDFGKKWTVPYGLYLFKMYVNPFLANQTGFTQEDLDVLLREALPKMFELDRSAARVAMDVQKIIVFKHDSALGNARSTDIFNLVSIARKDPSKSAREFKDYTVTVGKPPAGVMVSQ